MTELEKLKEYLDNHGYLNRWSTVMYPCDQIVVYNRDTGHIEWDAICHPYSYGGEQGLLEVMGLYDDSGADVIGYMYAVDVIKMLEDKNNENN